MEPLEAYQWRSEGDGQTKGLAAALAPVLQAGDCLVLCGDLGAGKTQFVQGLAQGLGVAGPVISPTFNILLCYEDGRVPLFHFDIYRLDDAAELEDVGYYDMLDAGGVVCIEWGDRFASALPDERLDVTIRALSDGARLLDVRAVGPRGGELLARWARAAAENIACCEESAGYSYE